jgi:hypothetical protein
MERMELTQAQQAQALECIALESKKRRYSGHISTFLGVSGLLISGAALIADHNWLAGYWPFAVAGFSLVLILRR